MERKTIEQIVEIEPRLQTVIEFAKAGVKNDFNKDQLYHKCKKEFEKLVGFESDNRQLSNTDDYDTVLNHIVDIIEY